MEPKYKALTEKLSKVLQRQTILFLVNNLQEGEVTSDIINLVLSAHLSSCFTCMNVISDEHPKMNKEVKKFIKTLSDSIASLDSISIVEMHGL